jgi:hypothetical protein
MSPASSCHGLSDLWIIQGNSWRIHDGTAGMMKNPQVLGQCRGSRGRGGEKRKGKEERRGREGSRERRARAGGHFAASRGAESASRCNEFLLQFVKLIFFFKKKTWCGGGVERKELNWGVLGGLDGFGKRRSRRRHERRVGGWEEKRECGFRASLILL